MGSVTRDQSLQIMATLAVNTDWDSIDFDGAGLQDAIIRDPQGAGEQFTAFLKNGGRVVVGEPKIVKIDRTKPFNPAEFIGAGWSVWRGPADGDGLTGEEEQDPRSLALTELDLTKVKLETCLCKDEPSVTGEERLRRLREAGRIRLDAKVFETFRRNPYLIPKQWKEKTNGNITYVFFDGTVLRSPDGRRFTLCLYWRDGQWRWDYRWLDRGRSAFRPSAVLASISA